MPVDDKFGYHELLHTAHIMTCMWSDHIEGHGALETDPELKAEADRIGQEVASFYGKVAVASDRKFGGGQGRKCKRPSECTAEGQIGYWCKSCNNLDGKI